MTTPLGNEAWVRRLIHCYSSWTMKAAFTRSSIHPCVSPGSCNHLHFVLLWSWFKSLAYISSFWCCECIWWVVPSHVTLHNVLAVVETRTVWFAVTATKQGLCMSHKLVTSPALTHQQKMWITSNKVKYRRVAPVWACCCSYHKQEATGWSHQSIFPKDYWTWPLCRSRLQSLAATQRALRPLLLLLLASRQVPQKNLYAHTLWSDLSYQVVAQIAHKNIASLLIDCYSMRIKEACI